MCSPARAKRRCVPVSALYVIRRTDTQNRNQHSFTACWHTVCKDAELGRLRIHDLRHTVARHAVMSGEHLLLVGKLLADTSGTAQLPDTRPLQTASRRAGEVSWERSLMVRGQRISTGSWIRKQGGVPRPVPTCRHAPEKHPARIFLLTFHEWQ